MVITLVLNNAFPLLPHGEEKVTVCGAVTGTPPLLTTTSILVVPKAESGVVPTPRVGALIARLTGPTAKPIELVTTAVPTLEFAVMVDAPTVGPPISAIVATPDASVSAEPEDGFMIPMVASALTNVTTWPLTGVPAASFSSALALTVVPLEIVVTEAPPRVNDNVNVGVAVPTCVAPSVDPAPQPESNPSTKKALNT
jgi:hypothetical protein